MPQPSYDEAQGYVAIDGLLDSSELVAVVDACETLLGLPEPERNPRDKVAQGTRHLFALDRRDQLIAEIVQRPALISAVTAILGSGFEPFEVSFRSPQPGFGGQRLHADDVPKLVDGPDQVATAIVALVDFTDENGATRVVPGSHRRRDLQRQSGSLIRHRDEIRLTGAAGTAFVFSGHLLHSGMRNDSASDRPALQLVWRRS